MKSVLIRRQLMYFVPSSGAAIPVFVVPGVPVSTPGNSSAQSGRDCEPGCVTGNESETW